jgi:hypothetical protein
MTVPDVLARILLAEARRRASAAKREPRKLAKSRAGKGEPVGAGSGE